MPCRFSSRAAASASSTRSPGQNLRTERRTNAALVARSRSQAFVELASRTFRITLMQILELQLSAVSPGSASGPLKADG